MKINYRKIMITTVALGCAWGSLALSNDVASAETITAQTTLHVPALTKMGLIKQKARIYNRKGHRVGKIILKKGKKITIYGTKKIRGKKYYAIGHGRYVLTSKVKLLKAEPTESPVNSGSSAAENSPATNSKPNNSTDIATPKPVVDKPTKPVEKPKQSTIKDFSINEFRQEFLQDLNEERAKRNLAPVTEDTHYDEVVEQRAALLPSNFDHVDAAGNFILEDYFNKAGISYHSIAECIAMDPWGWITNHANKEFEPAPNGGTSADVADNAIFEYIYDDAASNWGHRDILLNPNDKTIGVGAATTTDGYVYSSVGVTY